MQKDMQDLVYIMRKVVNNMVVFVKTVLVHNHIVNAAQLEFWTLLSTWHCAPSVSKMLMLWPVSALGVRLQRPCTLLDNIMVCLAGELVHMTIVFMGSATIALRRGAVPLVKIQYITVKRHRQPVSAPPVKDLPFAVALVVRVVHAKKMLWLTQAVVLERGNGNLHSKVSVQDASLRIPRYSAPIVK